MIGTPLAANAFAGFTAGMKSLPKPPATP